MKYLAVLVLAFISLTSFADEAYNCFHRNGRFGIQKKVSGKLIVNEEVVTLKYLPTNTTYTFHTKSLVEKYNPRTGSWFEFSNRTETISFPSLEDIWRLNLSFKDISESSIQLKCQQLN